LRVKSGSAMVITLLLLATVGSISFAVGRLFVLDLAMSRIYDDSVVAYYAAESGIEEGLLRYRFNKNAEIEEGTPGEADSYSFAMRNDLETYLSSTTSTLAGYSPTATDRVYDFRMYFREKDLCNINLGDNNGVCDPSENDEWINIPADESMKFDLTEVKRNDYKLMINSSVPGDQIAVEVKIIANKLGQLEPVEYKKLYVSGLLYGAPGLGSSYSVINGTSNPFVDFKENNILASIVGANINNIDTGAFDNGERRMELFIKPIVISDQYDNYKSGDINIMLKRDNTYASIAGLYSTIKSTGHYGNVTRTLKAEIDRQSGTLYDVFDFVLYDYQTGP